MTVIAFRDGKLAADTAMYVGDTLRGYMQKIVRGPDGTLAGGCGAVSSCCRFLAWIQAGEPEAFEPEPEESFGALVVRPGGATFCVDSTGHLTPFDGHGYAASGSGADVALGAMHAGASAEDAVRASIEWNAYCGGTVQVEVLGKVVAAKKVIWREIAMLPMFPGQKIVVRDGYVGGREAHVGPKVPKWAVDWRFA